MQVLVTTRGLVRAACCALFLSCIGNIASAQSTDIASPSAVRTNEVLGTIAARDIGDARLTDHYYAFTGTPGDLLITVDSRNLNGDIDVFTSEGLRPLLKVTVYAGSSSPVTKSIYFRRRESLILRVEGRTPNDDDATYRLHFGGSFEPITSGPLLAESENATQPTTPATSASRSKTGRRVSSVGARIEEPPPTEVASEPAVNSGKGKEVEAEPAKPGVARNTRSRGRGRRRVPAKPASASEAANKSSEAEDKPAETEEKSVAKEPAEQPKEQPAENPGAGATPAPSRRTSGRHTTTSRRAAKPPAVAEPESGPRLIIETSDGTLINRYMSTVRRVTVENGQVVVVGKDGAISRIPLASVVRMTIAP